jgi:periplasmic divalent cation tolerance protein
VLLKTVAAHYSAIERAIRDLHSYELPAIHAFAFEHVSRDYADWIETSIA